jgi:hypothetical protein
MQNQRMLKQTAIAPMEGAKKEEDHVKDGRTD